MVSKIILPVSMLTRPDASTQTFFSA